MFQVFKILQCGEFSSNYTLNHLANCQERVIAIDRRLIYDWDIATFLTLCILFGSDTIIVFIESADDINILRLMLRSNKEYAKQGAFYYLTMRNANSFMITTYGITSDKVLSNVIVDEKIREVGRKDMINIVNQIRFPKSSLGFNNITIDWSFAQARIVEGILAMADLGIRNQKRVDFDIDNEIKNFVMLVRVNIEHHELCNSMNDQFIQETRSVGN